MYAHYLSLFRINNQFDAATKLPNLVLEMLLRTPCKSAHTLKVGVISYLPFQSDVYRTYDTIIRIHVSTRTSPSQIMWCEMRALWCRMLLNRAQCHRSCLLVLVMESGKQTKLYCCMHGWEYERKHFVKQIFLTRASIWSFDDTNIRAFKYKADGILTSWSLYIVRSPFDFTSTNTKSSICRFICSLSAALAFIISAVVLIGKRNVQYVWSAQ